MALGRREGKQSGMWVAAKDLPRSPGHSFYEKLNGLLEAAQFDARCEELCGPYYAEEMGRPGIPPGLYFRMLLVGYFEGLGAQRAIAWKCADSLSVRSFLGLALDEAVPDHSTLTKVRQRLPEEVHQQVFVMVLEIARERGVLKGRTIAVDATTLEANAAMRSMVNRATGEDWKKYLRRLAKEAGIEDPSDEELRRFDKRRKNKRVSNQDWKSGSDPDSRIIKMKDGRTHFAYKAEHAVDLESNLLVTAQIYGADQADVDTIGETVRAANEQLAAAGSEQTVHEVVGDKGYHKAQTLVELEQELGVRTYIPDSAPEQRRVWVDKPEGFQGAVYQNRRRCRGKRGRRLGRKRSEYVERSFAHTCETGGGRRTWLRGQVNVAKRYWVQGAGHNLSLLMRLIYGVGTPRGLQGAYRLLTTLLAWLHRKLRSFTGFARSLLTFSPALPLTAPILSHGRTEPTFSTGC